MDELKQKQMEAWKLFRSFDVKDAVEKRKAHEEYKRITAEIYKREHPDEIRTF